tara:strand:+ start:14782 stop:14883 length:102 start_codon:yes stop_codon:yes gene_type:complete
MSNEKLLKSLGEAKLKGDEARVYEIEQILSARS